jgi:hypothetical protein
MAFQQIALTDGTTVVRSRVGGKYPFDFDAAGKA